MTKKRPPSVDQLKAGDTYDATLSENDIRSAGLMVFLMEQIELYTESQPDHDKWAIIDIMDALQLCQQQLTEEVRRSSHALAARMQALAGRVKGNA